MSIKKSKFNIIFVIISIINLIPMSAFAWGGDSLPFEDLLDVIVKSLTGPTLQACAIIAIVICGLAIAFGLTTGILQKIIQLVFGLAISASATNIAVGFFGIG